MIYAVDLSQNHRLFMSQIRVDGFEFVPPASNGLKNLNI